MQGGCRELGCKWLGALSALLVAACPCAGQGAGAITPEQGQLLYARHVLFTFPPAPGAAHYQLQVVVDGGEPDPFVNVPVFDATSRRARRISKEELEFGLDYAWRTRPLDIDGTPGAWSDVHRFSIAAIPDHLLVQIDLNAIDPERMQPGLTLTMMALVPGSPGLYSIAVDEMAEYVWFQLISFCDVRKLRNGNILGALDDEIRSITLTGETVWSFVNSRIDHHEAFDMPNGNVLHLRDVYRDVERDGQLQPWKGQQIFETTPQGQTVWIWSPFDHLSTLDFDPCVMDAPDIDGFYDWTHANAATYDAVENVVYYSTRHLSRIVKIDYATGEVIWNLGLDKPSGEVDFPGAFFTFQHAPEVLPNGHLLIYDNGNRRNNPEGCGPVGQFSSAVEIKIDPEGAEPVTEVWRYDHLYSSFVSNAVRLTNGNTLVNAGARGFIWEVAPDGSIVWELCAAPGPTWIYRATRIPSLYPLRGDADGDDDLDLLDFGGMQACFSGFGDRAIHRSCLVHDLDEDGDVDPDDFETFASTFTGHGP